uniref:anti-sigma factor n=1 Tax=Paenibacillus glycinis TaxID=2697035 RepID=UPI00191C18AD|nr:anti-sigma factor [Paenibacillus glycinis]
MHIVWEALPAAMDMMEPPADLKQQVMNAVRAADRDTADGGVSRDEFVPPVERPASRRPRGRKPMVAILAASASVILLLSLWNIQLRRERDAAPLPIEKALSVSASNIDQVVALKSQAPESAGSSGVACIIDNGRSRQFVVYLFGAAATQGDEAYQVWLVKDGKRASAGTFRVGRDSRGIGLLAMPIQGGKLDFDAIGITLEPDEHGSQPRGEKMYGSA